MAKGLLCRRTLNVLTFCKRSLFNENFLGVTSYSKKRNEFLQSYDVEKFKTKVREICEDPVQKVLSHHIKQICYFAETEEDTELVGRVCEKFCRGQSPTSVVFQNFTQGPELMRMYYFLNRPVEGLMLLQNPIMSNLFSDIKSYAIMQDLLYNNGMYSEVCDLFNVIKEKQIFGRAIPFLNYILFQAACYKMNTSESYNDAMEIFQEFVAYYKKPAWPIVMYTIIHALENGAPELSLKYPLGDDNVSVNIRLVALIKTGAISNAFEYFNTLSNKSAVIKSVAVDLHSNLEKFQENGSPGTNNLNFKDKININSFNNLTFEELAAQKIYSMQSLTFNTRKSR